MIGYFLNDQGFCHECSVKCRTCIDSSICLQCMPDYALDNENCIPCNGYFCDLCGVFGCKTFLKTVDDDSNSWNCHPHCHICGPACVDCHSNGYCYRCVENYILKNGVCKMMCFANCMFCSVDGSACIRCTFGFYLSYGKCFPC